MRVKVCLKPVELLFMVAVAVLVLAVLRDAKPVEVTQRARRHAAAKADIRATLREGRR